MKLVSALENQARAFAAHHHGMIGQRRKYTGEPYIAHPGAVADRVRGIAGCIEAMLAAAWLHDTVEDTRATLADVRREFGDEVAALVEMLTDVSKPEDGNRAARRAIDRAHSAKASPEAKTIKLADLLDNLPRIFEHDPKFAKVYAAECALLLDVLREGDAGLWALARDLLSLHGFTSDSENARSADKTISVCG